MYQSLKKHAITAFSLLFCLISAASCGKKKAVSTTKTEKLKPRPKTVEYTPTDEIKNAQLSSGLIQIGNDVFRNGGYYTVGQLMKSLKESTSSREGLIPKVCLSEMKRK